MSMTDVAKKIHRASATLPLTSFVVYVTNATGLPVVWQEQ